MARRRPDDLVAELRRQAAMRNATWPCILLSELMPLCDEYDRLKAAEAKSIAADAALCEALNMGDGGYRP